MAFGSPPGGRKIVGFCCGVLQPLLIRVSSDRGSSPRFMPLQDFSQRRRVVALVAGPFLWLVAIVAVAVVVNQGRAVEVGLVVVVVAFLLSPRHCGDRAASADP
jgi:hypothetical protein